MPFVMRKGPYRFSFFSNENREPAHVHVSSQGKAAKIWLEPIALAENSGFPGHAITRIIRIVEENHDLLLRSWNERHGT